jgi:thioredoxin 2
MGENMLLTCLDCGRVNRVMAARMMAGPVCGSCGHALADGRVTEVDLARLENARRSDSLPLVADIWAPWCGPCRAMAPEFEKAAAGLAGRARFMKVNSDRHPDAAVRFSIRGIPTLIRFEAGQETARVSGARGAADIAAFALGKVRSTGA